MKFDERLTELRKAKGLSQKDCAFELGMADASKYNKWENGKNCPDFETVCQLAKYFKVTADYLFGATDCKDIRNVNISKELGLSEKSIERLKAIKDNPENGVINYMLENDEFIWFMELFSRHKELLNKKYETDAPFDELKINTSRYDNPFTEITGDAGANLFAMQKAFYKLTDNYIEKCMHEVVDNLNNR